MAGFEFDSWVISNLMMGQPQPGDYTSLHLKVKVMMNR
jgi:hypothetical protein